MAGHFSVADDEVDEEMLLNKESGSPPGFAGRWYTKWVLSALAVSCAGVLCLHLVFTHTGPAGPRLRQLSSVSCDGKPHGSGKKWAIVDGGCNEYYGCSHGGSVRKDKCMLTLIWDEEKQVCDDPEKVTCGDSRLRQLSSVSCDGKTRGSGKKWAIVDGGCNEYYGCSHGGSVRKDKCMSTLIWDEEEQVCDNPDKVTCGDSRLRQLSS